MRGSAGLGCGGSAGWGCAQGEGERRVGGGGGGGVGARGGGTERVRWLAFLAITGSSQESSDKGQTCQPLNRE